MAKKAMPWDLLDPRITYVSEEVYSERYETCENCEFLRPKTKTCKQCNCFMKLKCALPHAFCPEGKWEAVEEKA